MSTGARTSLKLERARQPHAYSADASGYEFHTYITAKHDKIMLEAAAVVALTTKLTDICTRNRRSRRCTFLVCFANAARSASPLACSRTPVQIRHHYAKTPYKLAIPAGASTPLVKVSEDQRARIQSCYECWCRRFTSL